MLAIVVEPLDRCNSREEKKLKNARDKMMRRRREEKNDDEENRGYVHVSMTKGHMDALEKLPSQSIKTCVDELNFV